MAGVCCAVRYEGHLHLDCFPRIPLLLFTILQVRFACNPQSREVGLFCLVNHMVLVVDFLRLVTAALVLLLMDEHHA